ncbi:MAG TPA: 23S rRNA (guanosine(2251)-2'-O)-methyltransferase RlmB [Candidatus Faecisoma merdavium]|nr:23S rRNA (guanosine(2251)-2'-O)-methyltransferase RlmB [Candidatus Faecisoma merdavium]
MYVYGKNVAKDINSKIEKVYVANNFKEKEILKNIKAPIVYVDKNKLDKMVDGVHQGIVLKIADYDYKDISELNSDVVVMLDHLEDPHNFGAIIRTCEAAGVKDIIIPKDRSVKVNSTVMKTSAGCLDRVNIYEVTNLVQTINYLKKNDYWIIGTDIKGTDYKDIDYKGKIVIIIGNEGNGMSRLVKEACDFIATIPMKGEVNSLNASVAAGIIIFESRR